jgi:hypothetical protein
VRGGRYYRKFNSVGKLFGEETLTFRLNKGEKAEAQSQSSSALFQAALDTLSSYPLASCDATAGLIVTDWKEEAAHRHTKVVVRLKDRQPHVQVFTQEYHSGRWWDKPPAPDLAETLRKQILQKGSLAAQQRRKHV